MNIRSKLFIFYSTMLIAVLIVGAVSIRTIMQWRKAADNLLLMRSKSLEAEKIRAGMFRQINNGLDFLADNADFQSEYSRLKKQVLKRLDNLKQNAKTQEEIDHLEGLEETRFELNWMLDNIYFSIKDSSKMLDISRTRFRLREMADEVSDDIAVLNQYYRRLVDQSVIKASQSGKYTTVIIGSAVAITLFQLLALIFLTQRWLVKPISSVNKATKLISKGAFDTRINFSDNDEWGYLASSINNMAESLKEFQLKLKIHERYSALGEVAAFTAHNIQNPLGGIKAAAQVILDESLDNNNETTEGLNDIILTVDRLSLWVKRFLNFAKPIELQKELTNLNKVVNQALVVSRGKFSNLNIDIKTNFSDNIPKINIDPIFIEQTISAVIANALEAGGATVTINTFCRDRKDNKRWLSVTIEDNGKGMTAAIKSKLFRAFVTNKKEGTGLGLAQAKRIVDLHSGEIYVESSSDKGTIVVINLPVDDNIKNKDSGNSN